MAGSGTTRSQQTGLRFPARRMLLPVLIALSLGASGCSLSKWVARRDKLPTHVLSTEASLDEIVDHLNQGRSRVMGWSSTDVKVAVHGQGMVPRLNAAISVESPRRLRLMATSLRGTEVDFGSNDERFWFWTREPEPSVVLTGSHESLQRHQASPIPFPPEWLMEALSVVPIDPQGLTLERTASPGRVELISTTILQGQRMTRVMTVDLSIGEIVEHSLLDANQQLIAKAALSDFKRTSTGVILPHRIDLSMPDTKTELSLAIRQIDVNPHIPSERWQFQNPPESQVVDLDRADVMIR